MTHASRFTWHIRVLVVLALSLLFVLASTVSAFAASLVQISTDPYTNSTSQHQTQVEPDTYSNGSTIVSAFQSGRFTDGGASNIGWATSTNNGSTWSNGFLPGTTVYATPAGPYARVSDPTVAYDAAHNTWLIASLAINSSVAGVAVIVNQSTNGGLTWNNPVVVHAATGSESLDKEWIVCDDTSTSPYYGHCYAEWDDNGNGNRIHMSTSSDGGNTWGVQQTTANNATGIGGQPLVQPNGTVVVPIDNANETALLSFTSTNGGASWGSTVTVTSIRVHTDPGGIRSGPLPTAEIDGSGKVYVVWEDCRFESSCRTNDLVMTTSSNGTSWSSVARIPADPVGSTVDHFIPGLAVDKSTSGSTAHLVVVFYYYPNVSCSSSTCQLDIGYSSSANGGSTWGSRSQLAGPMTLSWLASTTEGRMVGDYMSTSFAGGAAYPVFMVATAPSGTTFHEAAYSVTPGLTRGGRNSSAGDPVLSPPSPTPSGPARTAF